MRKPKLQAPLPAALARLLDGIDDSLESGETRRAAQMAAQAAKEYPDRPEALRYHAAALAADGRIDEACLAFRQTLERFPADTETLRLAAETLILDIDDDQDALEEAIGLLKRALEQARRDGDEEMAAALELLAGMANLQLGEPRRALQCLERARKLAPDDPEIRLQRGIGLFELCELDEARCELEKALAAGADESEANYFLGLIAEHQGRHEEARSRFHEARRLGAEPHAEPIEISPKQFEAAIEDALERLPAKVRDYLANVVILAEDLPDIEELKASEPPLSPSSLGMFRGTPYTEQTTDDPWSHYPSAILLYRKNLQRFARSKKELIDEIGVTLLHEVGHFLGLDEEALYDRGLD